MINKIILQAIVTAVILILTGCSIINTLYQSKLNLENIYKGQLLSTENLQVRHKGLCMKYIYFFNWVLYFCDFLPE